MSNKQLRDKPTSLIYCITYMEDDVEDVGYSSCHLSHHLSRDFVSELLTNISCKCSQDIQQLKLWWGYNQVKKIKSFWTKIQLCHRERLSLATIQLISVSMYLFLLSYFFVLRVDTTIVHHSKTILWLINKTN